MSPFDDVFERLKTEVIDNQPVEYIEIPIPKNPESLFEENELDIIKIRMEELRTRVDYLIQKKNEEMKPIRYTQTVDVTQNLKGFKQEMELEMLKISHEKCKQFCNNQVEEINTTLKLLINELNRYHYKSAWERIKDRPNLEYNHLKLRMVD